MNTMERNERESFNTKKLIEAISEGKIDFGTIEECKKFAQKYKSVTTNQLRLFFGELRRIEMRGFKDNTSAFFLLPAKLAYSAARNKNQYLISFHKDMEQMLHAVGEDELKFNNFMKVIEAIVAYHKYFED